MDIKNKIYEIRVEYVILDSDLAEIYEVETKRINESVKNNPLKFHERYSFILTIDEYKDIISRNLMSKISTSSSNNNYGGRRYNIRVFTEQGVWMLGTILKSKVAINTKINIIDAFVYMRKYISRSLLEKNINSMLINYENRITLLENSFDEFKEKKKIYHLGASINHAGSKTFSINILEDYIVKKLLITSLN